mmetsp:Transcript_8126/g.17515  ORF Transcript_8126/g.17515 Transcript_8126/m.17515 type:complete len:323 (-) Transcript_8126:384-1352(-)|eukprot:CAMPEP_0168232168 /NCGR_PEP_ID=MMETSP0140_2-20121125/16989_1 /TAXON_ID=44445 /ORGANISM="Pseudo-nitzschia australis, Strain 10249 10 AB" /LENGTH=322 /DNA_ID=CAMNT_0008164677 /DNA_START=146 /DNA_END=1114 /DNA_ORIENTATION=-
MNLSSSSPSPPSSTIANCYNSKPRLNRNGNEKKNRCNNDPDHLLSELTESSLRISQTREVTRFCTNNYKTIHANKIQSGGIYSNGLLKMTTRENNNNNNRKKEVNSLAAPFSGMLLHWGGDSDWGSKRRAEFSQLIGSNKQKHHNKNTNRQQQLRKSIRVQRKNVNEQRFRVASLGRRRLRLERLSSKKGWLEKKNQYFTLLHCPGGTKGATRTPVSQQRRRQDHSSASSRVASTAINSGLHRRFSPGFCDEDLMRGGLEWKKEQERQNKILREYDSGATTTTRTMGRNKNNDKLGLEFPGERKKSQRALLDLQVGMKHMGL